MASLPLILLVLSFCFLSERDIWRFLVTSSTVLAFVAWIAMVGEIVIYLLIASSFDTLLPSSKYL